MSERAVVRSWAGVLLGIAGAAGMCLLWYLPPTLALMYGSVPLSVLVTVATVACLLVRYVCRGDPRHSARRVAELRLYPVGPGAPWIAGLAIVAPLADIVLLLVLLHWGYQSGQASEFFARNLDRPAGWLAMGAILMLLAPILEEFTFRGWILHALERRVRARWAILISAVLFAVGHGDLERVPLLTLDGVLLGVIVYLTGSIWAGVAVHAAINSMVALAGVPQIARFLNPLPLLSGRELAVAAVLLAIAFTFLLRGLVRATRVPAPCARFTYATSSVATTDLPP